jgi:hypothetical protein
MVGTGEGWGWTMVLVWPGRKPGAATDAHRLPGFKYGFASAYSPFPCLPPPAPPPPRTHTPTPSNKSASRPTVDPCWWCRTSACSPPFGPSTKTCPLSLSAPRQSHMRGPPLPRSQSSCSHFHLTACCWQAWFGRHPRWVGDACGGGVGCQSKQGVFCRGCRLGFPCTAILLYAESRARICLQHQRNSKHAHRHLHVHAHAHTYTHLHVHAHLQTCHLRGRAQCQPNGVCTWCARVCDPAMLSQDHIVLYSTVTWAPVHRFVLGTLDAVSMQWAPDSS